MTEYVTNHAGKLTPERKFSCPQGEARYAVPPPNGATYPLVRLVGKPLPAHHPTHNPKAAIRRLMEDK